MKNELFDFKNFKSLLDQEYQWPCQYLFKFIIPSQELPRLLQVFPREELIKKPSKKGNYLAITVSSRRDSSEDVIRTYEEAMKINGIISL